MTTTAAPAWLDPALKIIREFEGFEAKSYPDPGTGGQPFTIGWGSTRMPDGSSVRPTDVISRTEADLLLAQQVRSFGAGVLGLVRPRQTLNPNQIAALTSWAFNVGLSAVEDSTLRKRLNAGEDANTVARQELPRWDRGGGGVMPGLTRRRAAEVALFTTPPATPRIAVPAQQPSTITKSAPFSTRLTPHFTYGEFTLGQEARRFTQNYQVATAIELAQFLEKLKAVFNGKPVTITSGYRPPGINRQVGGVVDSEHLYNAPSVGAVDVLVVGEPILRVQQWIDRNWPYSVGYGAPKGFVHVGIRLGRPRVRWDY